MHRLLILTAGIVGLMLANGAGAADKDEPKKDQKKADDKTKAPDEAQVTRFIERMLETNDKNKDGKISKGEATGRLADGFDRIDTNKDGFLDRDELRVAARRLLAVPGGGPGPGGRPGPRGPDFDPLDKDADGRITREEAKGTPVEALFDQMDVNKDGKVSKKEFELHYRKQAEKAEFERKEAEKKEAEKKEAEKK